MLEDSQAAERGDSLHSSQERERERAGDHRDQKSKRKKERERLSHTARHTDSTSVCVLCVGAVDATVSPSGEEVLKE
ncbi:unnamed protein product [Arctogadus glacialis]